MMAQIAIEVSITTIGGLMNRINNYMVISAVGAIRNVFASS
jgi:hypothetical protein